MDLVGIVIGVIIATVVLSPALWLSGRLIAGKDKAKFTDALWIVFLGSLIQTLAGAFISDFFGTIIGNLIATIILLIIWLALIKHFFDCGWLKALLIAIVAVIIFAVVIAILAILLAIIGIGLLTPWF